MICSVVCHPFSNIDTVSNYDFHRLIHNLNLNFNLIIFFDHIITAFILICFFILFICFLFLSNLCLTCVTSA